MMDALRFVPVIFCWSTLLTGLGLAGVYLRHHRSPLHTSSVILQLADLTIQLALSYVECASFYFLLWEQIHGIRGILLFGLFYLHLSDG